MNRSLHERRTTSVYYCRKPPQGRLYRRLLRSRQMQRKGRVCKVLGSLVLSGSGLLPHRGIIPNIAPSIVPADPSGAAGFLFRFKISGRICGQQVGFWFNQNISFNGLNRNPAGEMLRCRIFQNQHHTKIPMR